MNIIGNVKSSLYSGSKKILILPLFTLVSLITSSYTETTLSAMAQLDDKATTNDVVINILTTRSTKDQEIKTMHEVGETSSNTPLISGQDDSTFNSTVGSGVIESKLDFYITKEVDTSSQMLTALTAHDQAMSNSTSITNEGNTVFVTRMTPSPTELAS